MQSEPYWGLPDPQTDFAFYDGVARKRLLAWVVDVIITAVLVLVAIPFTAFTGLFFLPMLWLLVNFVYRTATIAKNGATLGMRFFGIELRSRDGSLPDGPLAAMHTGAYLVMTMFFPAQLISIVMMLTSARVQGLHDVFLGTAVINRPDP